MNTPVLTAFNNKGGVGKTSLVYHLSWMFAELGYCVVTIDLDPQANLSTAFLDEDQLIDLWENESNEGSTVYKCVEPLTKVGDIIPPKTIEIDERIHLVPGDLGLANFEDTLSQEWPNSMGSSDLYRAFRILSAFWSIAQKAANAHHADLILADVGPNLGAINRSALLATDWVLVPLAADLFSLQGLKNLGPTLRRWRTDWKKRLDNWEKHEFELPQGKMDPIGYVVQQHTERLKRPVKAYKRWLDQIPALYRKSILNETMLPNSSEDDEHLLATVRHYRSLIPMAQEVKKPVFLLTPADGAIGSHARAAKEAYKEFRQLVDRISGKIRVGQPSL